MANVAIDLYAVDKRGLAKAVFGEKGALAGDIFLDRTAFAADGAQRGHPRFGPVQCAHRRPVTFRTGGSGDDCMHR